MVIDLDIYKEIRDGKRLDRKYVSRSRILCAKNGMFEEMKAGGGSAVAYAWYEFQKGYKGVSIIKWIN